MNGRVIFEMMLAAMLLSACAATRTRYLRPFLEAPATYPHADAAATASLERWWLRYGDPNLDALIDAVLTRNSGLALAVLNVRSAQLQTHLAVTNPTVTIGYSYSDSEPLKGSAPSLEVRSLTVAAAYEVDLWGQLGSLKDAARWEARATEQDRQGAALTVIGTAINLYYQLADLNYHIALGEQTTAYARKTLFLVKVQAVAGTTTNLEIAESDQNLQAQQAAQTALLEQRIETRNALTVLLNGTPWPEESEQSAVPDNPPPPVAADLPISLLDRRPDLRAAEMRLREALASTDATRLSFYPNLTLTGSLGTASTSLAQIVQDPVSTLAAALVAPFIQINQAKFTTELAHTQYQEAVVNFRKTLLQALTEVDNALAERTELAAEAGHLERSLEAAKTVEHLNEVRYRAGAVQLRNWLDAQEIRRQAEITLAANRLNRFQNYAALCQALGGGANRL
jgi:NodT family efflux transporter outer membrane factor (OMF) lipoprotein